MSEGLIRSEVQLTGRDGNAFVLIGIVARALERAGNAPATVKAFREEAMSGGYDHALRTCMLYAGVS